MILDNHRIFKGLEGRWSFVRIIDNFLTSSLSGQAIGIAQFLPVLGQSNLLHYIELGEFVSITGHRNSVTQEYFYKLNSENAIEVYFSVDGVMQDLFHIIANHTNIEHICLQDIYAVNYDFSVDQLLINYDVTGPKKRYISNTIFKRLLNQSAKS